MAKEGMENIALSSAVASPTNPKGRTDGAEFDELVDSVRAKGVLVPILVRPKGKKYEVVAGNRRFAAAVKAGLTEIPARIVELSDEEAREVQIIENLQRKDVHPLDEAEAFRFLFDESKEANPAEDIGKRVGKSETYVRDRMVLTNLIKEAKESLREGEISVSVASLIARLDPDMQKDAYEYANGWSEPDAGQVRRWIQEHVYVDFSNRPWENDAELMATLEGCPECKGKASANLFGKDAAEACTNPKCYAQRMAAYIAKKRQENPDLLPIYGGYGRADTEGVLSRNEYHEIEGKDDKCDSIEKGIIVEGTGMGHVKKICRDPDCKTHWATKRPSGAAKPTKEEREARKKQLEKERKAKEKLGLKIQAEIDAFKWPLSEKQLDRVLEMAFRHVGGSFQQQIVRRRGLKPVVEVSKHGYKSRDYEAPLKEVAKEGKATGKVRMLVDLLSSSGYSDEAQLRTLKGKE